MSTLPKPVAFEWDEGNKDKNYLKHKVTNQEAEEVFNNNPFLVLEDLKHSEKESRFHGLGKTNKKRYLFLSFTIRSDKIRIISVRDMNKSERIAYETH